MDVMILVHVIQFMPWYTDMKRSEMWLILQYLNFLNTIHVDT